MAVEFLLTNPYALGQCGKPVQRLPDEPNLCPIEVVFKPIGAEISAYPGLIPGRPKEIKGRNLTQISLRRLNRPENIPYPSSAAGIHESRYGSKGSYLTGCKMSELTDNYFYHTIEKPSVAEYKDRGSKFIAYAFPLNSIAVFKEQLQEVKGHHPKATHYCFAYRLGLDGSDFRLSDDGEPSGTAGRPILGQIDSRGLTNILIIIIRYFGGSLLGVPGLINAYKTAASFALQTTPVLRKSVEINYKLSFDYTIINEVMMVVKQNRCTVINQDMQLFCTMIIGIPKINQEDIVHRLNQFRSLEMKKQE